MIGTRLAFLLTALVGCAGAPETGIASCPPDPDPVMLEKAAGVAVRSGDIAQGRVLFERECTRCHSKELSLRGSRFFREYPRLDCDDYLARATPSYLYTAIAEGGVAIGRDELMKPFSPLLSDEEIASLVAFLKDGL